MPRREQPDITKLRYVLYARKSTEDDNRQVRSIDDQIRDCRQLANELGLHVIGDPIRETKSAKRPGRRLLFTQMLNDIEAKKYDAILCWHPDRLSRNMLESGKIIDMLDEGILQDIRFKSHQFSNDANGKMLLGMLFVFSKQYSDDLSDKVSRGVEGNFSEGKSVGTPKFGYDRDETTGLYRPNQYFSLIQEAWGKRIQGESVYQITNFLLDKGYHRVTKNRGRQRIIKPKANRVAAMFHDPFYYGLFVQASQTVDLREIYDFEPMISEDIYNSVQALSQGRTKDTSKLKRATFYPLRRFVYCAVCNSGRHMLAGKNKSGGGTYFLSYRCDNELCTRQPKSLRAKFVFNSIYSKLASLDLSDKAYERYSSAIDGQTDEQIVKIKEEVQSKRGALMHITGELNTRATSASLDDRDSPIYIANEKRISELVIQQQDLNKEIKDLEAKVTDPRQIKLSKEEFLNLIKTASDKMKAGSAVEKDALCRILFLNLRVDNEKVVDYIWNEPFANLVKAIEFSSGGPMRL